MAIGRARKVWLIGGAIAATVLVAITWFGLVGPLNALAADRHDLAADTNLRLSTLNGQIAELAEQMRDPALHTRRTQAGRALPRTPSTSDFLRELDAAGASADVSVTDVLIEAEPESSTTTDSTSHALPVTVMASGTTANLIAFLDQLQQEQPRAVLIDSAELIPDGGGVTLTGAASLTLRMQIFYAAAAPPVPAEPEPVGDN